jgi:hypothetical protein
MVELYLHSSIRQHGVVLNLLGTGTIYIHLARPVSSQCRNNYRQGEYMKKQARKCMGLDRKIGYLDRNLRAFLHFPQENAGIILSCV